MVQLTADERALAMQKVVDQFEATLKRIQDEYEGKIREILNQIKTRKVNRLKNELGMK